MRPTPFADTVPVARHLPPGQAQPRAPTPASPADTGRFSLWWANLSRRLFQRKESAND
jgi:hypothetical protein